MNKDIVKLDPKQFGLEESKAADIAAQFKPMLDRMVELETEYNEVIALPIESAAKQAKELRLKYVKVRTGTAAIHKEQKEFYLAGGRFIDGWKNAQLFASQGIEEKLEAIEKHAENLERERIVKLAEERQDRLDTYEMFNVPNLGSMELAVWESFLLGTKTSFDQRKEAERIAEEQRLAAIEAKRVEDERIRKENEELKAAADKAERELEAERKAVQAKQDAERAAAQKVLDDERKAQQALLQQQQREAEEARLAAQRTIDLERAERAKAEAELKAQQDAVIAAEEAKLAMGDKDKFVAMLTELAAIKNHTFKSAKHKAAFAQVCELIDKTIVFAKTKI